MDSVAKTRWICERAREMGFDLCGVAPADAFPELAQISTWLERGHAGEMNYLRDARRVDPRLTLEGARSLIVVALNYNSSQPYSTEQAGVHDDDFPRGWISRYAWGDDYHEVLREKIALTLAMRSDPTTRYALAKTRRRPIFWISTCASSQTPRRA